MKLIKKFFYSIWNPSNREKSYAGATVIKKELERPSIQFDNSYGDRIIISNFKFHNSISTKDKTYGGILYQNDHYSSISFNSEEVLFLTDNFGLSFDEVEGNKKLTLPEAYFAEVGKENIEDLPYINFKFLIDNKNVEYFIISFIRYPFGYPDRAKDQTDPYLIYIHGIWEKPFLTEGIIEKIKCS